MIDDSYGINTDDLRSLVITLSSYKKNIDKIFNEYKLLINNSEAYFDGDVAYEFRKKFKDFYEQLSLVTDSFDDFSNVLYDVIKKYSAGNLDDAFSKIDEKKELMDEIKVNVNNDNY